MGILSDIFSIFTNSNKEASHFEEINEKTEEKFVKEAIERGFFICKKKDVIH